MINLSQRNNVPGSFRSSNPLCTNVLDFSSNPTDPSIPLETTISLTFNAPIKASFKALGVVGFTETLGSFGLSSSSVVRPFGVENPRRYQIKPYNNGGSFNTVKITRYSDSPSTNFILGPTSAVLEDFGNGFFQGKYLRSNNPYLIYFYGNIDSSTVNTLFIVTSPIKTLPSNPLIQGLIVDTGTTGSTSAEVDLFVSSSKIYAVSSPQVIDLEVLSEYNIPLTASSRGLVIGSTSLSFEL